MPKECHGYDDIIGLPHPTSKRHPRMSMEARAAQFSPFAALTGYEDAVEESARLTDSRIELGEDARAALDAQLALLPNACANRTPVTVTYFVPDPDKDGGAYITVTGTVKKVDETEQCLRLFDGTVIPLKDIFTIGYGEANQ